MSVEESDIMAQLLSSYSYENESNHSASFGIPSLFGFDHDLESSYCLDDANSSLYCWPQGNTGTTCSNLFASPSNFASYYLSDSEVVAPTKTSFINICMVDQSNGSSLQVVPEHQLEESDFLNHETCSPNMEEAGLNTIESVVPLDLKCSTKRKNRPAVHDKENIPTDGRKKKARSSIIVQKDGRNAISKKSHKSVDTEEPNAVLDGQAYASKDNLGTLQEVNGGVASSSTKGSNVLKLNGKTRADRGSAIDPQSLYARKRRERINERLRMLQILVPNGTKVDISTMLEEAVQYVKFLQLQIKLLSSDDLWMYAPIAYNGMDIGLDLKISLPQ